MNKVLNVWFVHMHVYSFHAVASVTARETRIHRISEMYGYNPDIAPGRAYYHVFRPQVV